MNNAYQIRENEPKPLISVIVPVYKVEKYLNRCIDSILNQTWKNLEIILVDDGSPDKCGTICDEYQLRDERIRVIHKPNGGLSDARNAGLDIASGNFIGFVDSDDFIHPEMFRNLMSILTVHHADIAQCSYRKVTDEIPVDPGEPGNLKILTSTGALEQLYTPYLVDYVVAWNKLYKKSLFDGIRFPVGKIHEDEATTYKLFYRTGKTVVTGARYYYYFQSPGSIMRSSFSEKKLNYADAMEERIAFFREKGLGLLWAKALKSYVLWLFYFYYLNHRPLKKNQSLWKLFRQKMNLISQQACNELQTSKRFRAVIRFSVHCPLPAGFLIYHQMFKRNVFSKLAELLELK